MFSKKFFGTLNWQFRILQDARLPGARGLKRHTPVKPLYVTHVFFPVSFSVCFLLSFFFQLNNAFIDLYLFKKIFIFLGKIPKIIIVHKLFKVYEHISNCMNNFKKQLGFFAGGGGVGARV